MLWTVEGVLQAETRAQAAASDARRLPSGYLPCYRRLLDGTDGTTPHSGVFPLDFTGLQYVAALLSFPMSPSPLSPSVVHVLLQYISPPSQLTHAIPAHLLSKPLLQRHHFLHLTPEQPDEYLCWPSSPEKKAHVIELLESRPRPIDDDQPTVFPVQYSFDGEDFFAHVDLSSGHNSGPRVLLQWDDDVGDWRYHNTDLMPFPPGCRAELEDVLVPPAAPNPVSLHSIATPSYHSFDVDSLQDDSDDDDYWNAYGASDIGDSHYGEGAPASAKDTAASSEDAYWAQYASVQGQSSPQFHITVYTHRHWCAVTYTGALSRPYVNLVSTGSHALFPGTADSTIPSPIPQGRRKPLPPVHTGSEKAHESPVPLPVPVRVPSEDTYAEPLPIPPSIIPRPRSNSRWDPASPTHLAQLLSTISPRESPAESPAPGGSFDVDEDSSSLTIGGSDDSDLSSSPALGLQGTGIVAGPVDTNETGYRASVLSSLHVTVGVQPAVVSEEEEDLRAALEGVWKLWKKTRRRAADHASSGDREAREVFLRTALLVADMA